MKLVVKQIFGDVLCALRPPYEALSAVLDSGFDKQTIENAFLRAAIKRLCFTCQFLMKLV